MRSDTPGLPLNTLRLLLSHDDPVVVRVGAFVASELGYLAARFLDDVIPLLNLNDRYIQCSSMEVVAVCAHGPRAGEFAHVLRLMEQNDNVEHSVRVIAMVMTSRADQSKLVAAHKALQQRRSDRHTAGLQLLLRGETVQPGRIFDALGDPCSLTRKYGAIAAHRTQQRYPVLWRELSASVDHDLNAFFRYFNE